MSSASTATASTATAPSAITDYTDENLDRILTCIVRSGDQVWRTQIGRCVSIYTGENSDPEMGVIIDIRAPIDEIEDEVNSGECHVCILWLWVKPLDATDVPKFNSLISLDPKEVMAGGNWEWISSETLLAEVPLVWVPWGREYEGEFHWFRNVYNPSADDGSGGEFWSATRKSGGPCWPWKVRGICDWLGAAKRVYCGEDLQNYPDLQKNFGRRAPESPTNPRSSNSAIA